MRGKMNKPSNYTVIIMRHGHYDEAMLLDETGKIEVNQTINHLIDQGLAPDLVIHSPIRRVVQTAETIKERFNHSSIYAMPKFVESNLLREKNACTNLPDILRTVNPDKNTKVILLVTHLPNIVYLYSNMEKHIIDKHDITIDKCLIPLSLHTAHTLQHIFNEIENWQDISQDCRCIHNLPKQMSM